MQTLNTPRAEFETELLNVVQKFVCRSTNKKRKILNGISKHFNVLKDTINTLQLFVEKRQFFSQNNS